jgi:hypothetical protein
LTAVGAQLAAVGDLGATILQAVPEAGPYVQAITDARNEAISLATANTFLVGIVAAILAAGVVLLLREAPEAAVVAEREAMAAAGAGATTESAAAGRPLYTEQVGERPE